MTEPVTELVTDPAPPDLPAPLTNQGLFDRARVRPSSCCAHPSAT